MRIPGTKVYRAFPEFDRFTDEQCERFLAAAVQLGWRRVLRWVITGVAGVVLFVVAVVPSLFARVALEKPLALSGLLTFVADLLSVLVPSCVGGFGGVLVRDVLLRQHLRRLINTRGSCSACGYRLLGLPVSEANTVACPECGHVSEVDPSLGELTIREGTEGVAGVGAGGAQKVERLFTPKQEVVKPGFWTAGRVEWLKRWTKRGAITALAVVLAGGGFALYRFIIADLDASAAKAMYDPDNLMTRHIRSVQPEGTLASEPNGWDLVVKVHEEKQAIDAQLTAEFTVKANRIDPGRGLWVNLAMWSAEPVALPVASDPQTGLDIRREQTWNLEIELAREAVRRYEKAGLLERLDGLGGIRRYEPAILPATVTAGFPAGRSDQTPLRELWQASLARLRREHAAGDRAAVVRTVATLMSLQRRILSGIHTFDFQYGGDAMWTLNTAIGPVLTAADEAALAEMARLCAMYDLSSTIATAMAGGELCLNQATALLYSDASKTRWGLLSLDTTYGLPLTLATWMESRSLGRLQYNLDENTTAFKKMALLANLLPRERPIPAGLNAPPDLIDSSWVRLSDRHAHEGVKTIDRLKLSWRALETRIALERYKRRHGSYPGTLDLLVPEFLAGVPQEPWSAGPLHYKVLPTPDEFGRGYTLYSVGEDGVDDGGKMQPDPGRPLPNGFRADPSRQTGDLDLNPADVPVKFNE